MSVKVFLPLIVILFFYSFVVGQQITVQLNYSQNDLQFDKIDEYDLVGFEDGIFRNDSSFIGQPMLPAKLINVLLPPNSTVDNVFFTVNSEELLSNQYYLYPVQEPLYANFSDPPPFVEPDSTIYQSTNPFPEANIIRFATHGFRDYNYVSIKLTPFRYIPLNRELTLQTDITITVEYTTGTAPEGGQRLRGYSEVDKMAYDFVERTTINSQDLNNFYTETIQKIDLYEQSLLQTRGTTDFDPTFLPSEFGSTVKYVIITNNHDVNGNYISDLAGAFQQLADWKTKMGMPAKVVLIDEIKNHYQGIDTQEKIREFIKDAHRRWGSEYVLLGGDVNIVPCRMIKQGYGGTYMPSDLYYSAILRGLDDYSDNWNYDGDNEFCENIYDNMRPDYADQTPDIFVGRAPVENHTELELFLEKNYTYYRCSKATSIPDGAYLDQQLNLGAIIHKGYLRNNIFYFYKWTNSLLGIKWKYRIATEFDDENDHYNLMEYLANAPDDWSPAYEIMDGDLTLANTMAQLNVGYGIINHLDHAGAYALGVGRSTPPRESISNPDIASLTNGNKYGVLYSGGCEPAPFDKDDCIGEKWLLNPNGGGVSFIGTASSVYTTTANSHDHSFFSKLYDNKIHTIGWALKQANTTAYLSRIYQLLGDPHLSIYTDMPQILTVTHDSIITSGNSDFDVNVSGIPEGLKALVCVKKDNEAYAYMETENGAVTFNITPDTPGEMSVTVTAPNCEPYEAAVDVAFSLEEHLFIYDHDVDDDKTGQSYGNSDDQLDAGETIELFLTITNGGINTSQNAYIKAETASEYLSFLDDSIFIGNVSPGQIISLNEPIIFQVSTAVPDGEIISVNFQINSVEKEFDDQLFFELHAPVLSQINNQILDGGDGIQPGETIGIYTEIGNYGSANSENTQVILSSESEYVSSVDDSVKDYAVIEKNSSKSNQDDFNFTVGSNYQGETLWLDYDVEDDYGKTWNFQYNLDKLPPLPNISFTNYYESIDLTWYDRNWYRSNSPELYGYNVYRSDSREGAYTRLNTFPLEGTSYYHDSYLTPCTDYYYTVTAVNNSGNESSFSDTLHAWTTLPYLDNWPIIPNLSKGIFGGPTISNVDNDNDKEIFLTNTAGLVLAFNPDGSELFDIDNNPETVSGFYNLDSCSFWSTPVISDINKDDKNEIILTTRYGSNMPGYVFVFQAEDNNGDSKPDLLWTFNLGGSNIRGVVISDLDGDGYSEIIAHKEGSNPIYYILNHDGTVFNQWQVNTCGGNLGLPAVVDLDNDGNKEIIEGFGNGELYIWKHDGTDFNSNPVFNMNEYHTDYYNIMPPVVADIDKDGNYEIFILGSKANSTNCYLYVIDEQGHIKNGWNGKKIKIHCNSWVGYTPPSVSIGDINQDGDLDITCAYYKYLKVWDASGNEILSKNISDLKTSSSSPNIADVDGGGDMEIIFPSLNGKIHAYKYDGSPVKGCAIIISDGDGIETNPVIDDIDGDGKSEIVCGVLGSGKVHVWQTEGDPNLIEWGHYRYDNQQTGLYVAKKSGTITSDEIWSGVIDVVGDITINSGAALTIRKGSLLRFKPGFGIEVNGSIVVEGTSDRIVRFTSNSINPLVNDWDGIKISGSGASACISYSKINYASIGIIFEDGASGNISYCTLTDNIIGIFSALSEPLIQNCIIENNSYGIRLINAYQQNWNAVHIENNTIANNSLYGLYMVNASPTLYGNIVQNNDVGLYLGFNCDPVLSDNEISNSGSDGIICYQSSSPDIYYNSNFTFGGYNSIVSNGGHGISCSGVSNPNLGQTDPTLGGYNSIENNAIYEVNNLTPLTVYACNNWWGNPSGPQAGDLYGSVEWEPALSEAPSGGRSSSGTGDFVYDKKSEMPEDLQRAYHEQMTSKYEDSANRFKKHFNDKKESSYFDLSAIQHVKSLGLYKNPKDISDNIEKTLKEKQETIVEYELLSGQASNLVKSNQPKKAIEKLDKALKLNIYQENKNRLLFQKYFIYTYHLNDKANGKSCLNEIIEKSSKDSEDYKLASEELDLLEPEKTSGKSLAKKNQIAEISNIPKEYALLGNFPNPFNPSTSIRIALPHQSAVRIYIFNILGQKIKTVDFSSISAGYHNINWEGVNSYGHPVSSGLYIYRFEAISLENKECFEKSSKMLLIR